MQEKFLSPIPTRRQRAGKGERGGLWIVDCRLLIADCRLPIADCRLPIADC
jgi:hypothetical protein